MRKKRKKKLGVWDFYEEEMIVGLDLELEDMEGIGPVKSIARKQSR